VYTLWADELLRELADASDLRTLETAGEISRLLFARSIASAWAAETFGEGHAA
jgi:hypothetical protein